jgi:hypothetical protein
MAVNPAVIIRKAIAPVPSTSEGIGVILSLLPLGMRREENP